MSVISEQEYITRIAALERVNAVLAEQVDRMRPVVDAACCVAAGRFGHGYSTVADLKDAVVVYQQQMAELAKGDTKQ
jgi:hypothetical protein